MEGSASVLRVLWAAHPVKYVCSMCAAVVQAGDDETVAQRNPFICATCRPVGSPSKTQRAIDKYLKELGRG
jgi:hypothetical protein